MAQLEPFAPHESASGAIRGHRRRRSHALLNSGSRSTVARETSGTSAASALVQPKKYRGSRTRTLRGSMASSRSIGLSKASVSSFDGVNPGEFLVQGHPQRRPGPLPRLGLPGVIDRNQAHHLGGKRIEAPTVGEIQPADLQ